MFRILSGKFERRMDRVSAVLMAYTRHHSFIIQEERSFGKASVSVRAEMDQPGITPYKNALFGMRDLPVLPTAEFKIYHSTFYTRETLAQVICEQEIYRPAHNIECRQRELQQQSLLLSN